MGLRQTMAVLICYSSFTLVSEVIKKQQNYSGDRVSKPVNVLCTLLRKSNFTTGDKKMIKETLIFCSHENLTHPL